MNELRVPAKLYDAALSFCNARRKAARLEPWESLPAGMPNNRMSCPCAQAVDGLFVGSGSWIVAGIKDTDDEPDEVDALVGWKDGSSGLNGFIDYFDDHAIGLTRPLRGLRP